MQPPRLWTRLRDVVLEGDAARLPRWRRIALFSARLVVAVTVDFARGELSLRAMSLVYATLLSLVPLLALSFSMLNALGVHSELEAMLARLLAPLGQRSAVVSGRVIDFVGNIEAGALGTAGLLLLFYTLILMVLMMEQAFNFIWHVRGAPGFIRRLSHYISVLLVGPVLVFFAVGIATSVFGSEAIRMMSSVQPFGYLVGLATKLVPYLLIIAAFAFIYMLVPNTRVRFTSALVGAVLGGVLWQTTGLIFASFMADTARYTSIYSAFATLIIFMVWLYLSWLILLIGSSIAHYHQYPSRLLLFEESPRLSIRMFEHVGLCIMAVVAERHYARTGATTAEVLARRLDLPLEAVMPVLEALVEAGLLRPLNDEEAVSVGHVPGTPLDETTTDEVLAALRRHGEIRVLHPRTVATPEAVRELLRRQADGAIAGPTLRSLAGPKTDGPAVSARSSGIGRR